MKRLYTRNISIYEGIASEFAALGLAMTGWDEGIATSGRTPSSQ